MATKNTAFRVVIESAADTGSAPNETIDTNTLPTVLTLAGYTVKSISYLEVAVDADDLSFPVTEAIGLYIDTEDYPFGLKISGSDLMENCRVFGPIVAYDEKPRSD